MEASTNLVKAGTEGLIDVADHTTKAAVVALRESKDILEAGARAPINVAGRSADAALDEIERMQAQLADSIRVFFDALLGEANRAPGGR